MYTYNIMKQADEKIFYNICKRIEAGIKNVEKKQLLEDVDGTLIQLYDIGGKEVKVVNDIEVDAVYVDSEISLNKI
ncbi:MAG: hypothetical protein IJB91_06980 [Oscillospiraceae bacterium]|nr:hypothetical protein [Oscillospiraceae bacterium]